MGSMMALGLSIMAIKDRKPVVAALHAKGMSNRAIGKVVGVDETTIRRELTAPNGAPDAANGAPSTRKPDRAALAEIIGREYPAFAGTDGDTIGRWVSAKSAIAANAEPPASRQHFDMWQFQTADQDVAQAGQCRQEC
jgi:hypothetical protein